MTFCLPTTDYVLWAMYNGLRNKSCGISIMAT